MTSCGPKLQRPFSVPLTSSPTLSLSSWTLITTFAPAGAVLRRRADQRLVNQKQYQEAKRLLKEYRARYRQLVRGSLRTVFRATPPPQARPALRESQPKFGRFLEFMDEFCQESTTSDLKD